MKDDTTEHYLGLLYLPEGILDNGMFTLEASNEEFSSSGKQPKSRQTTVWIESIGTTPTFQDCYVLVVPNAKCVARYEENWLSFFFGGAIEIKPGDAWKEQVAQKDICFRYTSS